jgi:DNA-binding NtrC family response regulator
MPKVLAVDDDRDFLSSVHDLLSFENYEIDTLTNSLEARALLEMGQYDCVLLDVKMPGIDGLSLLQEFVRAYPEIPVIMISGQSTLSMAVEAIKIGAYDFLEKGADLDRLLITLQNALERKNLFLERQTLLNEIHEQFQIVGRSEAMQKIVSEIDLIAPTDAKVLISGETGTGKELVARAIHLKSKRSARPYIKVNCAAIPDTLIESTFFGHVKGSFTGAVSDQQGKFEQADGGTLFLDEIGELPPQAQSKLLRVLESGEIEKIGSREVQRVDVRIIAATNKNLKKMVEQGKFREDLYHRLVVYQIEIPPLRKRPSDIPVLSQHFLRLFAEKYNKPLIGFSSRAMEVLRKQKWPGNVRMLSNVVEKIAIITEHSEVPAPDVFRALKLENEEDTTESPVVLGLEKYLHYQEKEYLKKILKLTNGNKAKAARLLEIDRATLWRKLVRHGMDKIF